MLADCIGVTRLSRLGKVRFSALVDTKAPAKLIAINGRHQDGRRAGAKLREETQERTVLSSHEVTSRPTGRSAPSAAPSRSLSASTSREEDKARFKSVEK